MLYAALITSVFAHTAYYLLIARYEANLIAPLNYTQMIGSVIVGYLVFTEVPDFYTWIGSAVIKEIEKDAKRVVPCLHSVGMPLEPGQRMVLRRRGS